MEGKRWITAAVSGIALLLCSFLILITINPQLISLQNPKLETITIPPHLGLGYNTFNDLNQINNAPYSNTNLGSNAENAIQQAAQYYGISPNLIKAVMGVESGKNATALSPKGAQGLMQLMPGTAAEMGVRNSYDPVQNIWGGAGYIAKIINTYSRQYEFTPTAENVLRAYNAGPAAVEKSRSYKETNSYVNKLGKISGTSLENPLSANQRSSYKIPM
jgi:soluble lytic murein transglycosylase-like protein